MVFSFFLVHFIFTYSLIYSKLYSCFLYSGNVSVSSNSRYITAQYCFSVFILNLVFISLTVLYAENYIVFSLFWKFLRPIKLPLHYIATVLFSHYSLIQFYFTYSLIYLKIYSCFLSSENTSVPSRPHCIFRNIAPQFIFFHQVLLLL